MKKYLKWLILIIVTTLIATIILIESIYFLYIGDFKPYFIASKNRYSIQVEEVILAENGINHKPKIEYTFLEKEIFFINGDSSSSFKLLARVVKTFKYPQDFKGKERLITQIISPIWISRHWSYKEVVSTLIDRYYGVGIYTFKEASLYYFNKKDEKLNLNEIVTLIAISINPSHIRNIQKRALSLQKKINKYSSKYKNYVYKMPNILNCKISRNCKLDK